MIITQERPVPTRRVGTSDIVGFGLDGVIILRNSLQPITKLAIANFSYNTTWRVEKHVRLVGDTTGDGLGDIIGFGDAGVYISRNKGKSFSPVSLALGDFGSSSNWTAEIHVRYVADLRKKGYVDLIGFGDEGVFVSLNNGSGTYAPARLVINDFGFINGGWKLDRHLRFLADVNGNGNLDIVAFGENKVFVALGNGDGTFEAPRTVIQNQFTPSRGWRIEKHPRTLADLTGDGKPDMIGFADGGVYIALNNGDGTFQSPKLALNFFGSDKWEVDKHPRFVADVNGNGLGDIVGFGDTGVYVAFGNGDGTFQDAKIVVNNFGYADTWRVDKHPRFLADLTGDGAVDIIGFGDNDVWVSYNDGNGNFKPHQSINKEFSLNGGWTTGNTVRWMANL
ncbi:hypothetical protein EST38_g2295 [Candolleomyces aberdarensis]|uniref:VCBS repeat-containing protein n=1 Tax=Candolleomyces aberdarensis TaxID=2316362 RepID=A0A4Q2DST5_9AGAR|nr:hypothetical protein EST38_g2295 [Candolleomyces aberdarensis]